MDNGNVLVLDIVDHHLAHARILDEVSVPEHEEIPALEGRLHGARQDDDDGGRRVGDDGEALPHLRDSGLANARDGPGGITHHKRRRQDEGKVQDLRGSLPRVCEGGEHAGAIGVCRVAGRAARGRFGVGQVVMWPPELLARTSSTEQDMWRLKVHLSHVRVGRWPPHDAYATIYLRNPVYIYVFLCIFLRVFLGLLLCVLLLKLRVEFLNHVVRHCDCELWD